MYTDSHKMNDEASVVIQKEWTDEAGTHHRLTADDSHSPVTWKATARVELRTPNPNHPNGIWSQEEIDSGVAPTPFEVVEAVNNLLMTQGANDLWTALSTAGLASPYSTTNAYLGVGDSATAASVAQTDLQAAVGASLGGGIVGATTATPVVIATSTPHGVIVGQVVQIAAVGGNTGANGTFEVSVVSDTTHLTLLNSVGAGAYTSGGTVKLQNRYFQQANASGSAVVTTNQIVFVAALGTANGNYQWNEWCVALITTTNKQAAPPVKLFNRATPAGSLITKTVNATSTLTVTLSLA